MVAVTFDTLSAANRLKANGLPSEQAEAIAKELQHVTQDDRLVTRSHFDHRFDALDQRFENLELWMTVKLGGMIIALGGILIAVKYFG